MVVLIHLLKVASSGQSNGDSCIHQMKPTLLPAGFGKYRQVSGEGGKQNEHSKPTLHLMVGARWQ